MDFEIGHVNISVKSEKQKQEELQDFADRTQFEEDEGIAGCPWEDDKPIVDWHHDSYVLRNSHAPLLTALHKVPICLCHDAQRYLQHDWRRNGAENGQRGNHEGARTSDGEKSCVPVH